MVSWPASFQRFPSSVGTGGRLDPPIGPAHHTRPEKGSTCAASRSGWIARWSIRFEAGPTRAGQARSSGRAPTGRVGARDRCSSGRRRPIRRDDLVAVDLAVPLAGRTATALDERLEPLQVATDLAIEESEPVSNLLHDTFGVSVNDETDLRAGTVGRKHHRAI